MPVARGRGRAPAGEAQPQSASASSSSARSSSRTRRAPSPPPPRGPRAPAADQHRVGAEREGDRDVDAAADAAVDQHRAAAGDRVDRLGQGVGGGAHAVELAAAVVGDDDARRPVLDRERRVLGGQHPLDEDRQARTREASSARSGPAQRRVHQREGFLDRHRAAPPERRRRRWGPRAPPGCLKPVRGSRSRLPPRGASTVTTIASKPDVDRLVHQRPGHPLVPEAVELEPAPALGGGGGDLARPRRRQGREAHHRAGRRGGPRHRDLALRVDQPLVGDRRDQDRHRELRPPSSSAAASAARRARPAPAAAAASAPRRRRCRAASPRRRRRRRSSRARRRRASRSRSLEVGDVDRVLAHGRATLALRVCARERGQGGPRGGQIRRRRRVAAATAGLARSPTVAYLVLAATVFAPVDKHGAELVHLDDPQQGGRQGPRRQRDRAAARRARSGERSLLVFLHGRGGSEGTFNDAVLRGLPQPARPRRRSSPSPTAATTATGTTAPKATGTPT